MPGSDYPGPAPGVAKLEALSGHAFQFLLQLNGVGCRVSIPGGGRAVLLGADASSVLDSATGTSVSIWVVRRGRISF
jgi:hypothetical protein